MFLVVIVVTMGRSAAPIAEHPHHGVSYQFRRHLQLVRIPKYLRRNDHRAALLTSTH
jgi:hypothetical protein